jgi:hypothetical protein
MFERCTTEELKGFAGTVDEKSGYWIPYTQHDNFETMCKSMRSFCSLLDIKFKNAVDLFFIHQDVKKEIYCREIAEKYKNISDDNLENMKEKEDVIEIELELYRRKRKKLGIKELPILLIQLTDRETELLNDEDIEEIPFRRDIGRYKNDITREQKSLNPDAMKIKNYEKEILSAEKQITSIKDKYKNLLDAYYASLQT